jgi:hypothetical protein
METWLAKAMFEITLIEAGILSVLLALVLSWMGLRGFFRMMLAASLGASPVPSVANPAAQTAARRSAVVRA